MAHISYKEISLLSLEEITKELPVRYKQLELNKAEVGKQKGTTFIVGMLLEMNKRRIESRKSGPILRLKMQEVLESGLGSNFEAIIYGENVKVLEEKLQDNSQQKIKIPTWIIFVNVNLIKYTGMAEQWLPFSLKVVDEDNEATREQKMYIFKQSTKPSKRSTKIQYSSINEVKDKSRSNLFVVVKEVIKNTSVLNNNNKHTMLSVVDPTCLYPTANRAELLVHIFFNDPKDHLPDQVVHGDILRLRELLGDYYAKEKKMFGKVLSSNAIVKFRLKEESDAITPYTSNQTYEITDHDRKIVQDLRRWWDRNCDCYEDLTPNDETGSTLKRLCDFEKSSIFTLRCQVKKVRLVPSLKIVALRVEDGTAPKVYVSEVNFDEATMDFSSQGTQYIDHIKTFKLKELDVTVLPELYEQALKVKEGDFVELVNLIGENITQDNKKSKGFDFCMKGGSEIVVLHPSLCKAKHLASAIQESNTEPDATSEESREADSREGGTLDTTHSSEITSLVAENSEKEEQEPKDGECPYKRHPTDGSKETPGHGGNPGPQRHGIDTNGTREEDRPGGRKNLVTRNSGMPAKRKLCVEMTSACNGAVKRKMTSYIWQKQEVNTECNIYSKSSLTEFFTYSNGGDKCRVWALLKHIHYTAEEQCKDCEYLNCYHNWIWGLCNKCSDMVSSAGVRQRFSKEVLLTEALLPCSCSPPSSDEEPTLHPFIKLELCLQDLHNDNAYSVDLSGDMAQLFFGVEPSFSWIVDHVSPILQERTNMYKELNHLRPFQFCLVNRSTPDGGNSFHICDTALKF